MTMIATLHNRPSTIRPAIMVLTSERRAGSAGWSAAVGSSAECRLARKPAMAEADDCGCDCGRPAP